MLFLLTPFVMTFLLSPVASLDAQSVDSRPSLSVLSLGTMSAVSFVMTLHHYALTE